jgi:hypothetical protein
LATGTSRGFLILHRRVVQHAARVLHLPLHADVPAEEIDVVDSRREQLTLPLPWRYVSAAEPAKVPTTFTVVLP